MISIAIPTYNRNAYLKRLLDTLTLFTNADLEVLVVDGYGSAFSLKKDYPEISFFEMKTPHVWESFNACISLSHGDYLCIFHDDDLIRPEMISTYQYMVKAYPHVGLMWSYPVTMNEKDQITGDLRILKNDTLFLRPTLFPQLLERNCIAAGGCLVKRECYEKLGGFHELRYALDWEMWLRISLHYDIFYIDRPLWCYRLHSQQLTNTTPDDVKNFEELMIKALLNEVKI